MVSAPPRKPLLIRFELFLIPPSAPTLDRIDFSALRRSVRRVRIDEIRVHSCQSLRLSAPTGDSTNPRGKSGRNQSTSWR